MSVEIELEPQLELVLKIEIEIVVHDIDRGEQKVSTSIPVTSLSTIALTLT